MQHTYSLVDYIKELPVPSKSKLYESPLFTTSFIKLLDQDTISFFFELILKAPNIKTLQNMQMIKLPLKTMLRLGLIEKKGANVYLNSSYRSSFLRGISELHHEVNFKLVGESTGEGNGVDKFDNILKSIVSSDYVIKDFGVHDIIIFGGLINSQGNITNTGFEFLLKNRVEQMWCLVILAIKFFCKTIESQVMTIESLLELSLGCSGSIYSFKKLIVPDFFRFLGSISLIKLENNQITLQPLFEDLFTRNKVDNMQYIIIETNFKLYAYTKSLYEVSIIKLFCDVYLELPNLIKGVITEDSMNRAFDRGIKSENIIHFLKSTVKFEYFPHTVENQIYIWETKRDRIKIYNGFLYSNFLNLVDYQNVSKFCGEKDFLISRDDSRRILVVKPEHNDKVKEFVKNIK